ncbi:MAG: alanine--tRNA ligase [Roseiflexaceae bacterium]
MHSQQIRQRYLEFFLQRQHAVIGHAPLTPEHDASVLFTTAGMHPLVPFLLGEAHPAGNRLVNVQPCLRTNDILEVGDSHHLTFFEMCGNWSLGDYWKEQSIQWSYTFLTEVLGFEPQRLAVTCFTGDQDAPRDEEAAAIWRSLGIERIAFLPKEDNWWGPAGPTGPCGPDTEIFYDVEPHGPADQNPGSHPGRFREIWNNVFMAYDRQPDGRYTPLAQKNVDTGLGLERVATILQGQASVYETDLFVPLIEAIRLRAPHQQIFAERVIADHVRAATFVLAEGIRPDNVDQPYILRRLIRRAVRYGREIGIQGDFLADLSDVVVDTMVPFYPILQHEREQVALAFEQEEGRFRQTLARGERFFGQLAERTLQQGQHEIPGGDAFQLYETYGFPLELTEEYASQRGLLVDRVGYQQAFVEHQQRSRMGAEGRFRGGLAERNPQTTKLHTATHLLHAALRQVLGDHVGQRGSNITAERLRFDFSHPTRLLPEQIQQVEALVNQAIQADLVVTIAELPLADALAAGAIGLFGERYGDRVKVYTIGTFSSEICGGPHVQRTSELGHFRIQREESVAAGVRRIKATIS